MLRYFGEHAPEYCGKCSNCLTSFEEVDITETVRDIIGCINVCYRGYGTGTILETLRGNNTERVERYRLYENSYYGSESDKSSVFLKKVMNHMEAEGYIIKSNDRYGLLETTEKAGAFLLKSETLKLKIAKEKEKEIIAEKRKIKHKSESYTENPQLFEELRALRMKIAKTQSVPPYVIFTDKTLNELCSVMPASEAEMLKVSGVGEAKLRKYGKDFLKVIKMYHTL